MRLTTAIFTIEMYQYGKRSCNNWNG